MFKVCIFGDGGVGKTCLVNRYLTGIFKSNSTMTLGVDFLLKTVEIEDKKVALQIWDFAGEDRFRFLFRTYVTGASAGIFMFDITRITSLNNLPDWLEVLYEGTKDSDKKVPIIMVGGKLDLQDRRSVYSTDAIDLAKKYELHEYIECSSKSGENVEIIFYKIARKLTEMAGLI